LRTIGRVILPLTRGGAAAAAALIIVLLFHEFAASILVSSAHTQVMGAILYEYWTEGTYPQVAAMAIIMVVVTTLGVAAAMAAAGSKVLEDL
jgi:iron(III) transport system permease protein